MVLRFKAENIQDEPGAFYSVRKKVMLKSKQNTMMGCVKGYMNQVYENVAVANLEQL